MKQALIFFLLISVVVNGFGQQTTPTSTTIQSDYLKKSKKQKTAAWILLGGGAALFIVGAVIPKGEEQWDTYYGFPIKDNKNDGIKGLLYLTGTLSMIGSIPLFIASGKNKRRAMSVSADLQMQNSKVIQRASLANKSYPAVAVKLNF
jgi:hypothetical protein